MGAYTCTIETLTCHVCSLASADAVVYRFPPSKCTSCFFVEQYLHSVFVAFLSRSTGWWYLHCRTVLVQSIASRLYGAPVDCSWWSLSAPGTCYHTNTACGCSKCRLLLSFWRWRSDASGHSVTGVPRGFTFRFSTEFTLQMYISQFHVNLTTRNS